MPGYNRTEAAQYLGISRRTLFNWLEGSTKRTFTKRDLDRLAAKHQHPPQTLATLEALTATVEKLQDDVELLKQRVDTNQAHIAALEVGAKPQRRSTKGKQAAKDVDAPGQLSVVDTLAPADTSTALDAEPSAPQPHLDPSKDRE